jgi:hypothetical protein
VNQGLAVFPEMSPEVVKGLTAPTVAARAASRAEMAASRAARAAAERKWQADRIREIVENPWGTK